MDNMDEQKKAAAEKAAEFVQDGMSLGLGSGSTVYWLLKRLGERVQEGLNIQGVPSSLATENWAKEFGIPLTTLSETRRLDLAIDGADEADPDFNLTKGGGGALLREKLVNDAAERLLIVVDESKMVEQLGKFPLPVEIVPFGWENTAEKIASLNCKPVLRKKEGEVFVTNNSNYILDCSFHAIPDAQTLHGQLKMIVGVVETGLFINMADIILVGTKEGIEILEKP